MSKDKRIQVHTDHPIFFPGDTVSGKVLLNLTAQLDASTINFRVKGYEKSYWEYKKPANGVNPIHNAKHIYISTSDTLHSWGGQIIPPGQYSFPFSFKLPDNLPGSYEDQNGIDSNILYKGIVKYKVKAFIMTSNKAEKIKGNQIIIVKEQPKVSPPPSFPDFKHTQKSCFNNADKMDNLVKYFTQDVPSPNANNAGSIQNEPAIKQDFTLTDITCSLIRKLVLSSPDGESYTDTGTLYYISFGGASQLRRIATQLLMKRTIDDIANRTPTLEGTSTGKYLQCSFQIKTKFVFDDFCASEEPEMILSASVAHMPPKGFDTYIPPQGWNPQSFPIFQAPLTNDQVGLQANKVIIQNK